MGGKPVWCRTAPGPLERHVVGYARWLAEQGFSESRIERRVDQLGHLSHWLAIEGLGLDGGRLSHLDLTAKLACPAWVLARSWRRGGACGGGAGGTGRAAAG